MMDVPSAGRMRGTCDGRCDCTNWIALRAPCRPHNYRKGSPPGSYPYSNQNVTIFLYGHHRRAPESMQSWCVRAPSEQPDGTNSLTKQAAVPNQENPDFAPNSNVFYLMW